MKTFADFKIDVGSSLGPEVFTIAQEEEREMPQCEYRERRVVVCSL